MSSASRSSAAPIPVAALLVLTLLATGIPGATVRADAPPDHLVVSEVVTGGLSASDEFIEIHNPTASALPLEGLELVYVTASGATISRRAAWDLGAPDLAPGRHLLVANELGVYAGTADILYGSGMASTGGSVALRIQGAASAIDAVGWGTAASTWLEGLPAPAPAAGSSLERLPGGTLGSTVDTDDNRSDFVVRSVPEPQNLGSVPTPDPSATPGPSPTVDPDPTVAPTTDPTPSTTSAPTPTPTPNPESLPIGTARALPDGTAVTIEGTALTDAGFTDGGGFVADASGGIAVLVSDGTYARGDRLRLTGTIDDRFSQRTLRVGATGVTVIGIGAEPDAAATSTGAVGETVEGRLVRVAGSVLGSPSELSTGLAFDLDDGTGTTRLVVGTATGIDASAWKAGTSLDVVGVVGQRDSSGTGIGGYRVYPRDAVDIVAVDLSPTASPAPSDAPAGTITIAAARSLPKNAHARVRGTVTLPPGIVDPATAVLQDASGAIVIRIGEEVGPLSRGDLVVVDGVRSTKSGMETLRVTTPPTQAARGAEPAPEELRTGTAGEADEAKLVQVRGALVAAARRSPSGTLSLEIDDGSGPLRISIGASVGAAQEPLTAGTWLQVTGVLGQDTTGAQPLRGYRVWPRDTDDLRILAAPTGVAGSATDARDSSSPASASVGLSALGGGGGDPARIGATLVVGAWPDVGIGGLLWDGDRLVALASSAAEDVERLLEGGGPPLAVELFGLRAAGTLDALGLPLVRLGEEPDAVLPGGAPVAPPATRLPERGQAPRWVAIVGRLAQRDGAAGLALPDRAWVALDVRCAEAPAKVEETVGVLGVATADPTLIVVPCGGMRPAPGLDTARDIAAVAVPGQSRVTLAAEGGVDSSRPIGAVALLGAAALGLLAAAVVTRRLRDGDGVVESPVSPDGDAPGSDAAQPQAGPPMLTLVTLPRDRAP